ncbi:MAG: hypothetical protein QOH65_1466 [Methylobacteriaceae bacterium]|nr:hypothetical protein [Methylobacteriaceae bacterium]
MEVQSVYHRHKSGKYKLIWFCFETTYRDSVQGLSESFDGYDEGLKSVFSLNNLNCAVFVTVQLERTCPDVFGF